MLRKFVYTVIASALLLSCSSDKEDATDVSGILGTWDLTALQIDENNSTSDEEFGKQILDFLAAQECYIITLTFNEDLSVVLENSGNYIEINVNPDGTGLDIPCPTQSDIEVSTYTYDGELLSYIDENLETVTVTVQITGNTMTINAVEFGVENLDTGGQLVFTRR
ncbi:lipocalin family protein [Lentiprolixibacter aurantiacus]|uniref:Lipocalin family protein n=1 Tax=Lentiprolixibacter aurantiacus TaxID=2993939 RepID=A0AAE3MLB8_9FLAO|nr:lipocalin family protein [Lentiprolixibacter aurantiacus]MCX2719004.1 lipocalin family protein [Lentiprolixibacter aurantiacus]